MARPKRITGEKTARERMEDAFWDMLAEMPYDKMTGKEICARAQVSHNSFYYHFDNMEDMARQMFEQLILPEMPLTILHAIGAGASTTDGIMKAFPDAQQRFNRMCLLANSGSPFLIDLIKKTTKNAWLNALGLKEENLTLAEKRDITFALGGAIALLSSGLVSFDPETIQSFAERDLAQGIAKTMSRLAQRGTEMAERK